MPLSLLHRCLTVGVLFVLAAGPAVAQGQAAKTGTGLSRSPAGAASGQSGNAAGGAAASGASGGLSVGAIMAGVAAAAALGALVVVAADAKEDSAAPGNATSTASTQ